MAAFRHVSNPGSAVEAVCIAVHLAGIEMAVQVQGRGDAGVPMIS
jgi:hypothetical protein